MREYFARSVFATALATMRTKIGQMSMALILGAALSSPVAAESKTKLIGNEKEAEAIDTEIVPFEACDEKKPEFRGGVGFYFIRPQWNSNTSYGRFTVDAAGNAANTQQSFNYDFTFSPKVWAGVVNKQGLGVRAKYWHFDQGMSQSTSSVGDIFTASPLGINLPSLGAAGAPTVMNFDSQLKLYAVDFDFTKDIPIGNLTLLYWGGFRYAHIAQNYSVVETGGGAVNTLTSGQNRNGFGPTVGLEDRYKVGDTGLSLYGNFRGSVLCGNGKQNVTRVAPGLAGNLTASESLNNLLPIAELEVGSEYAFDVGRARMFVNVALVCQAWFGAGNSSRSSGSAPPALFPALPDTSAINDGNLGLYGLTVNSGVNF